MLSLGDPVRYRGRTFVVAGFRPRSQHDDCVLLEHVLSREQLWVAPDEIEEPPVVKNPAWIADRSHARSGQGASPLRRHAGQS